MLDAGGAPRPHRGGARARRAARSRRRSRPARRVARPRRVPDRAWSGGCPESSAACRPRCSRPCWFTTRSTSRCVDAAAASTRFAAVIDGDGAPGSRDRRGAWSAWWWRGCATRPSSWARTEAPARRARGRPRRRHLSPGPRQLRATRSSAWSRSSRRWAARGLLAEAGALAAAKQAAQLAKADLTTLMVREFPELQGVMGGIYLQAQRRAGRRGDGGALALPADRRSSRGRAGRQPSPARTALPASSRRWRWPTSSTRSAATSASARARPEAAIRTACAAPAQGAVRVVLDFWRPEAGEPAPDLEALVRGRRRGLRRAEAAADVDGERRDGVPARPARVRAHRARLRGRRGRAAVVGARRTRSTIRSTSRGGSRPCKRRAPRAADDFAALAEAFKRAKNIVAQAAPGAAVEPELFEADAERGLHAGGLDPGAGRRRLRGAPAGARRRCARRRPLLRRRAGDGRGPDACGRTAWRLLQNTLSLFYRIADISRLGGTS